MSITIFLKKVDVFSCSFIAAPLVQNVSHFTGQKSGPSENLFLQMLNFLLSRPEEQFSFQYLHEVVLNVILKQRKNNNNNNSKKRTVNYSG